MLQSGQAPKSTDMVRPAIQYALQVCVSGYATEGDMRLLSLTGLRREDRVAFDEILHKWRIKRVETISFHTKFL